MLAGGAGCSQPHAIEQARKDFKIYMTKLLHSSAALDTFRPGTHLTSGGGGAGGGSGSGDGGSGPAWGPPVGEEEESGGGSVGGRRASPPAGVVDVAESILSASYFNDKQVWPRAGAVTPPRPRPPPNFSWIAYPQPSARAGSGNGCGGGSKGGSDGGVGKDLFPLERGSDFGSSPTAAAADAAGVVRGGRQGEEEEEELGEGGDGWKAVWARRFARGPIHSEYQDRFPWPPEAEASGVAVVPSGRRNVSSASASALSGGGMMGRAGGATAVPAVQRGHKMAARSRGNGGGGGVVEDYNEEGRGTGGEGGGGPERGGGGRGDGGGAVARTGVDGDGSRCGAEAPLPRRERWPLEVAGGDGNGGKRTEHGRRGDDLGATGPAVAEAVVGGVRGGGGGAVMERRREGGGSDVRGSAQSERMSAWEVVDHASGVGDETGLASGWRERDWQSRAAEVGSSFRGASLIEESVDVGVGVGGGGGVGVSVGVESLRDEAVAAARAGRGKETMSGGRTIDLSCQSILTEYMDEFGWPAQLPVPGRRGKRSGMGMDHVGRLLAGKRAEEPARVVDAGLVARLGAAADAALKAGSPVNLSEMCSLKAPSPAARRLVLGLVAALGLRFDRNRAGLTSGALRPFAEDPSLSPAQVRKVSACMVWVSRWLRALHDYLAAKEGNIDAIPLSRMPSGHGNAPRRHSHGRARGAAPVAVPGTDPGKADVGKTALSGERRDSGVRDGDGRQSAHRTRSSAPPPAPAPASSSAAPGASEYENEDCRSRERGRARRSSKAAATRGTGTASSCPPISEVDGGSRRGFADGGDGVNGQEASRRRFGEGDGGAGVGFMENQSNGDFGSESEWTAGTVTSRGDVLGAPTEDQVDAGSPVSRAQNARTFREKYNGGGSSAAAAAAVAPVACRGREAGQSSRRWEAEGAGKAGGKGSGPPRVVASRATVAALKPSRKDARRDNGTGGGGSSSSTPMSSACIYRHERKGDTASHFANPKARTPTRTRWDPILANARWRPAVRVRECDRTEQRSAFTAEHSILAVHGGGGV